MRSWIRENAPVASCATAVLVVVAAVGLRGDAWPDWQTEARPAIGALTAGHLLRFLHLAPVYGGSLILRAPLVMVTRLWHGGELAIYGASAAPCLAALGVLGVWLVARMRAMGRSVTARGLALMLCVANPLILPALEIGHPEELLGAVLCVAAVLCAMGDRSNWAAVLLGLAIANKEWAVLAAGPVLLSLEHARLRTVVISGVTAGILIAPFMVGASDGVAAQTAASGLGANAIFQPWQFWWFLGSHAHPVHGLSTSLKPGYRTPPGWIENLAHPLVVAVMPPLSALWAWLRRRGGCQASTAPLLLLALLLALRCGLDPWDISYYALPFLLALVTWESLSFNRAPILASLGALLAWAVFQQTSNLSLSADAQALVFALVSMSAVIALAIALYTPGLPELLRGRPSGRGLRGAESWQSGPTPEPGLRT
jgi:hypothetical protein